MHVGLAVGLLAAAAILGFVGFIIFRQLKERGQIFYHQPPQCQKTSVDSFFI